MGAPTAEITRQRVNVQLLPNQRFPQLPCALNERLGCARRQGNHIAGPKGHGLRPDTSLRRAVFADHAVPVGAAEAK